MEPQTVLALDIGGTKIAAGLVQVEDVPRVTLRTEMATDAARGGAAVLDSVKNLARQIIDDAPQPPVAIGIGAAGVVDPKTGSIVSATDLIPGWAGTRLRAELMKVTGLPVAVVGDVAAHALGEHLHGAGAGARSCLAVGIGTGIGGAYVQDGEVATGAHGVAGHVGHVASDEARGLLCSCGRTGHIEPFASGTGIAARYNAIADASLSGREVEDLAQSGDADALEVTTTAGFALGRALGSLANTLDPEVIILSGSVTRSGRAWWDAVRRGYADQAMDPVATTPILRGTLGGDAPLVGATSAALALVRDQDPEAQRSTANGTPSD